MEIIDAIQATSRPGQSFDKGIISTLAVAGNRCEAFKIPKR
jgi:hypothetical protein